MAKNGTRLTAKLSKSLVDKEPRSARSLIPKEENNMPYLTFSFRYCFLMKQIAFFILCCLTLNIIYSHQKILDML